MDRDADLLAEAKALVARQRLLLSRLIKEGLAMGLGRAVVVCATNPRPNLPVHTGRGGLTAAVTDPSRTAALLDAADGLEPKRS